MVKKKYIAPANSIHPTYHTPAQPARLNWQHKSLEIQEMDTMDNKEVHIDVEPIRLLIAERKGEIKREFKAEVVGIFGSSYARGEEKEGSDIDFLVRFGKGATLFDLGRLGDYLEDLFGVPVDVVSERALHQLMKDEVLKELVPV